MDVDDTNRDPDTAVSRIAAAIGEPARARILYCLMDGHARTSTELSTVAGVSPSTASVHLSRLHAERLIKVFVQGRHRYYSLEEPHVAKALEALNVLAGGVRPAVIARTPGRLRAGRTCYDHLAGTLGVALHDRFTALQWLTRDTADADAYTLTTAGGRAFAALGVDLDATRAARRRFAYPCLDWSERRPHLGGALAAAVCHLASTRKWVVRHLDSRAVDVTPLGRREIEARLGVRVGEDRHPGARAGSSRGR